MKYIENKAQSIISKNNLGTAIVEIRKVDEGWIVIHSANRPDLNGSNSRPFLIFEKDDRLVWLFGINSWQFDLLAYRYFREDVDTGKMTIRDAINSFREITGENNMRVHEAIKNNCQINVEKNKWIVYKISDNEHFRLRIKSLRLIGKVDIFNSQGVYFDCWMVLLTSEKELMHFSIHSENFEQLESLLNKSKRLYYPGMFEEKVLEWDSLTLWSKYPTVVGLRNPIFSKLDFKPRSTEEEYLANKYHYFPLRTEYTSEVSKAISSKTWRIF